MHDFFVWRHLVTARTHFRSEEYPAIAPYKISSPLNLRIMNILMRPISEWNFNQFKCIFFGLKSQLTVIARPIDIRKLTVY